MFSVFIFGACVCVPDKTFDVSMMSPVFVLSPLSLGISNAALNHFFLGVLQVSLHVSICESSTLHLATMFWRLVLLCIRFGLRIHLQVLSSSKQRVHLLL